MATARTTFVTERQATVHALFTQHRSMSAVARILGVSQITVRESLVQFQRNKLRDQGITPPPLREMLRGDVTTRFGVSRKEAGGRPSKHVQLDPRVSAPVTDERRRRRHRPARKIYAVPTAGVRRLVVTTVEAGARVHLPFWRNLQAYAAKVRAELAVIRLGAVGLVGEGAEGLRSLLCEDSMSLGGVIDLIRPPNVGAGSSRPLDAVRRGAAAEWIVAPHPGIQFETLPRLRTDGLRAQLTTGAVTLPRAHAEATRTQVGAAVLELRSDGYGHCRHLLADVDSDGTFQDLRLRVRNGVAADGCRAEALTFGDVHHAHMDPVVARMTWGLADERGDEDSLVDRLKPRTMIFHDVCDFEARNHHDAADHHKRFFQMASGGGDVRAELCAVAEFLEATRRPWSRSVIVNSNHDAAFTRWLREADFRTDQVNAVFFLEASLALHRRMREGKSPDHMFEYMLRRLSSDGLSGVRFLSTGESLKIRGIENAIHGHQAADGRRGSMPFFERLGLKATLGHTHRPTTREGIYCVGVCQPDLDYARGLLTAWAVGHVVTYATGARQHLILNGGRFFA